MTIIAIIAALALAFVLRAVFVLNARVKVLETEEFNRKKRLVNAVRNSLEAEMQNTQKKYQGAKARPSDWFYYKHGVRYSKRTNKPVRSYHQKK